MHVVALLVAIIIALSATNISNRKAREYINGGSATSSVTPGSGEFFDSIAQRYDLLNQVISLGYHASWRRAAIQHVLPADSVLDVSTGTADLAINIAADRSVRVVGLDPSQEMLKIGHRKLEQKSAMVGSVELVEGVAEALPFEKDSFDAVIVAFGVRNFQNRSQGLAEMSRVLKPGGKCVILELSLPAGRGLLDRAVRLFVTNIMPKIASFIAGKEEAYQYLSNSMAAFPNTTEFEKMMEAVGLKLASHERLPPFGRGPNLYAALKQEKQCTDT